MPNYRLTNSFPYLARRVGLRIGELFDRRIAESGVTVSEYRVLASLTERDDQRLGDLAAMTTIELSTLSRLVGAMSKKRLVTRKRPPDNGRVVAITLTARGRSLAAELMPIAAHFEAVALGGLGEREAQRLKSYLEAAYDNLDALEREVERAEAAATARHGRPRATSRT